MGAYENPITVIDNKSGAIIANAIANLGTTTANAINTYWDKKNKEIKEAAEKHEKEVAEQNKYKDQVFSNIQKSNIFSESWYKMTDAAINRKFELEAQLQDAVGKDRAIISAAIQKEQHKIRLSMLSAGNIQEWKTTDGKKFSEATTNEPGGIFTGSDASEWSKEINLNYQRKQAIVGNLMRDGKPATVEYKFKDIDGVDQIFASINGGEDFNVMDTLNQDYVEIDNVVTRFNKIWEDSCMQKNGKFDNAYLNQTIKVIDIINEDTKEVQGQDYIRTVNTDAVVKNIITGYKAEATGMAEAVDNRDSFNDLNATYLEFVPKGKPLEPVREGVYKLSEESKIRFIKDMVGFALEDRIQNYEYITASKDPITGELTYINNAGEEVTTDDYEVYTTDSGMTFAGKGGEFKTQVQSDIDKKQPPAGPEFNKSQTTKINNTVNMFKNAKDKGYNFLVGVNLPNLGTISDVEYDKETKELIFNKDRGKPTPGKDGEMRQGLGAITGYKNIKLKGAKLRTVIAAYVKQTYDYGNSAESRKIIDNIMSQLSEKKLPHQEKEG